MGIKEYYDINYIKRISEQMTVVCPDFPKDSFIDKMASGLGEQTYTEKMIIITVPNKSVAYWGEIKI